MLFIADYVFAVMELDSAAPERWKDSGGIRLQARVAAHKVLTGMRAVGAMIGGVAPHRDVHWLLGQSMYSLTSFLVGDIFVVDMEKHSCQVRYQHSAWPKEDYRFSLEALCRCGLTWRSNRLYVAAEHKKAGGDGKGPKRRKADKAAAKQLLEAFPKVVVPNHLRAEGEEVVISNGQRITNQLDANLATAVSSLSYFINDIKINFLTY